MSQYTSIHKSCIMTVLLRLTYMYHSSVFLYTCRFNSKKLKLKYRLSTHMYGRSACRVIHVLYEQTFSCTGPRRLFILRHAERVDVTFGKQWIQLSFDPDGYYQRCNLNMPKEVPHRKGGPNNFLKDAPVTEVGLLQAHLMGEGIREQGIRVSHVFSSPALRCVQCADSARHLAGAWGIRRKNTHRERPL